MGKVFAVREKKRTQFAIIVIVISLTLISANRLFFDASPAYAAPMMEAEETPTPTPTPTLPPYPQKYRTLYARGTDMAHQWMLISYNEDTLCYLYMPTLDKPADQQVLGYCGFQTYKLWADQQACEEAPELCNDIELYYIDPLEEDLDVVIYLPGPLGYAEIVNCPAWGECDQQPLIRFGGFEPLYSEHINKIYIQFDDLGIVEECDTIPCEIPVPLTPEKGTQITFNVTSSYGDESKSVSFKVRNIALENGNFLFQTMGEGWWDQIPAELKYWEFFPPLTSQNLTWAADVSSPEELATDHDYAYLAGKLILRGAVSAAGCEDGGLLPNGAASACGLEAAHIQTTLMQNQYDAEILEAAHTAKIPPKILKGIIGQESQFWNEWVIEGEYGMGMMTDKGADMLLNYDTRLFLDLCTPVYGIDECAWGYGSLGEYPQAYLRGRALTLIGTDQEFELIGRTIAAATGQTGQIIRNITGEEPEDVLSYKELWLISIAIYHGGGGCVGVAAQEAYDNEVPLTWGNISEYLLGDCQSIASYPYMVLRYGEPAKPTTP